jgi:hypothetical protein
MTQSTRSKTRETLALLSRTSYLSHKHSLIARTTPFRSLDGVACACELACSDDFLTETANQAASAGMSGPKSAIMLRNARNVTPRCTAFQTI